MITNDTAIQIAKEKFNHVFGSDYIKKNGSSSLHARGINGVVFTEFLGIKDKSDFPNEVSNKKGWVVYANIEIDMNSGELISFDYSFPENCRN